MTNNNRRQLARVRNAFLGATALAGFAALATPASAVVINDALTPTQAVDPTNITGVGQMVIDLQNGFIGLCTVSLINPRTVIFASHCVNENPAGNAFMPGTGYGSANGGLPIGFFFNVNNNVAGNSAVGHWLNGVGGGPKDLTRTNEFTYNSNFVVYNTNCCTMGLQNNFLQSDIAIAALDTPAVGIPTYTLLFSALTAPVHATITGYGDNGTGTTGQGTIDFKRRIAENIISVLGSLDDQDTFLFGAPDGLPANLYMIDFNDPKFNTAGANVFDFNIFHDIAVPVSANGHGEGITAPGDSGGPLIVDHAFSSPTIAAVLSGGDRFFNAQKGASYGTTSFYQPLYLYWDWILANNPYKYVTSIAGAHNWRDATAFAMALDPAYMTVSGGQLVNALPTTPAAGQTNVPPGFGFVCYFDDCINIKTGVHTNPTPAPGPNPANVGLGSDFAAINAAALTDANGNAPTIYQNPFGHLLGSADAFNALVGGYLANQDVSSNPERVSASLIDGVDPNSLIVAPQAGPGGGGSDHLSPQTNWNNPEGTASVAGVFVQGAPSASPGQIVQDTNANTGAATPARYYDVTIAANGTITQDTGTIVVDKVTVNGASAGLTVATGATLQTLISTNSFAGTTTVNGTLTSTGPVSMFGGVLQGTGTINAPSVDFLIGAVAPGTNGTVGTLTVNGNVNLGAGSTLAVDFTTATTDKLTVNGNFAAAGTLVVNALTPPQLTDTHIIVTATTISGNFNAVPDTVAGVLFPVVTKVAAGAVFNEVVSFQAGTFVSQTPGGTADQLAVGGGLDGARGAHYNDLKPLYLAIDPLSGAALGQALENLAPDAQRAGPGVNTMQTEGFDELIWQRLEGVGGHGGGQTAGLHIDGEGLRSALNEVGGTSASTQQFLALGQSIATNPGGGNTPISTGVSTAAAAPSEASESMLGLPNGAGGFLTGSTLDGTVAIGGGGGVADVNGLIIAGGLDTPVGNGFTIGGSLGYSSAEAVLRSAPATLRSESFQGAVYARYDFGRNLIAEGFVGYSHQTMRTMRVAVVGLTSFTMQGHTSATSPSGGLSLGKEFDLGGDAAPAVRLVPSIGIQYVGTSIQPFTETGGAPAMTFSGYSEGALLGRIGFDADVTFGALHSIVTPNLHVFWVNDLNGRDGALSAAFAAAPSNIMSFGIADRDRSYGEIGVGADIDMSDWLGSGATLTARYDTTVARDDIDYGAFTGRLSIKF